MNSDLAIDTVNKLKKAHCFTSVFEYLNESLTEDASKEVKIAGFVDCSGSNGKDSINNQLKILKNAGVTEIYYFSDKIYTDPESA
jgi:predicted metal-binding protein